MKKNSEITQMLVQVTDGNKEAVNSVAGLNIKHIAKSVQLKDLTIKTSGKDFLLLLRRICLNTL